MKPILVIIAVIWTAVFSSFYAHAQEAVIAIVNDHPVTGYDIDQRIRLLGVLGLKDPARLARKAVANNLIDDYVKIDEAKLHGIEPTEKDMEERLVGIASSLKTDRAGLPAKLSSLGVTAQAVVQYSKAQMSFARLLQVKYHTKVEVNQADVDKKLAEVTASIKGQAAKFAADPRRQPVLVLQLQEINFPIEGTDPGLFQSRAIEANQIVQKMKSCSGIKQAAAGIFNVQIGKKLEADSRRIPPQMMAQLKQRGVGHPIGPMRYAKGIQLLALCGTRTITPPPINVQLPTRQQIEGVAFAERFDSTEKKFITIMRKNAIIEYKDPSYAQ